MQRWFTIVSGRAAAFLLGVGVGLIGCAENVVAPAPLGVVEPVNTAGIGLPASIELADKLGRVLRDGTGEEKARALDIIRTMKSVAFIPELIEAIDDPTPSPREGDTGWGFTGHHAATVLGEIAYALDGVRIETRGRAAYSFFDDSYEGGAALAQSGRLARVRSNWEHWWDEFRAGR